MEDGVGRARYPGAPHLVRRGVEQRERLGRSAPDVLVQLAGGAALRLLTRSWLRDRVVGAGLVLVPPRHPGRLR